MRMLSAGVIVTLATACFGAVGGPGDDLPIMRAKNVFEVAVKSTADVTTDAVVKAALGIPGVKEATFDANSSKIALTVEDGKSVDAASVAPALKSLGLTVEGVKPPMGETLWVLAYSGGGG